MDFGDKTVRKAIYDNCEDIKTYETQELCKDVASVLCEAITYITLQEERIKELEQGVVPVGVVEDLLAFIRRNYDGGATVITFAEEAIAKAKGGMIASLEVNHEDP